MLLPLPRPSLWAEWRAGTGPVCRVTGPEEGGAGAFVYPGLARDRRRHLVLSEGSVFPPLHQWVCLELQKERSGNWWQFEPGLLLASGFHSDARPPRQLARTRSGCSSVWKSHLGDTRQQMPEAGAICRTVSLCLCAQQGRCSGPFCSVCVCGGGSPLSPWAARKNTGTTAKVQNGALPPLGGLRPGEAEGARTPRQDRVQGQSAEARAEWPAQGGAAGWTGLPVTLSPQPDGEDSPGRSPQPSNGFQVAK